MQGVRQVKNTDLDPVYLFISPPDTGTLKTRLRGRGTDSEEAIQKRLRTAIAEIEYAKTGAHDIVIINDDLNRAYEKFKKVALGEEVVSDVLPPLADCGAVIVAHEELDKSGSGQECQASVQCEIASLAGATNSRSYSTSTRGPPAE